MRADVSLQARTTLRTHWPCLCTQHPPSTRQLRVRGREARARTCPSHAYAYTRSGLTLRVKPSSQPSPRGRFAHRRAPQDKRYDPTPSPHTERVGPAYANHELTRTRAPRARTHTLTCSAPTLRVAPPCPSQPSRRGRFVRRRTQQDKPLASLPRPHSALPCSHARACPPTSHSVPPLPPQPLCSAGRAHLSAACSCAHLLRHRENTSLRHCHLSRSSAVGRPDKSPGLAAPPTVPSFGRGSKRRGCTQRGQAGNGGAPSRRSFLRRVRWVCHLSLPSFGWGRTPFCGLFLAQCEAADGAEPVLGGRVAAPSGAPRHRRLRTKWARQWFTLPGCAPTTFVGCMCGKDLDYDCLRAGQAGSCCARGPDGHLPENRSRTRASMARVRGQGVAHRS